MVSALVFLTIIGFTVTAILAFLWAAGSGQFRNQQAAARSIFDADEPVGRMTDRFPGAEPSTPILHRP
jgi:cbb3-type cytochrome oxidase maturation protein